MENVIEYCKVTGKRKYSEKMAGETIRLAKKNKNHSKKIPLRKYFCKYCNAWHTTHEKTKLGGYNDF